MMSAGEYLCCEMNASVGGQQQPEGKKLTSAGYKMVTPLLLGD